MTAAATLLAPVRITPVRRAVSDIVPLATAALPFGTVIGVTLDQAGLTGLPAMTGTALIYAGSAQLAALTVLVGGGAPLGALLAGAIVNSRLLLYSAGLSAQFREHPAWFRWLAPWTTVDQTFALATQARDLTGRDFRQYWVTMGAVLGAFWMAAVALGMGLGSVLPHHNPMEIAAPAVLISLLVPSLQDRRMRRVAATAALVAIVARGLPSGLGIVVAVVVALTTAGSSPKETS